MAALVPIKCQNPNCISSNTVASYSHAHGLLARTWNAPAVGPTPDSAPFPSPCPNDDVSCAAISVKCNTCGWTKSYPV